MNVLSMSCMHKRLPSFTIAFSEMSKKLKIEDDELKVPTVTKIKSSLWLLAQTFSRFCLTFNVDIDNYSEFVNYLLLVGFKVSSFPFSTFHHLYLTQISTEFLVYFYLGFQTSIYLLFKMFRFHVLCFI